jgi:hypothetical protein
MPSSLELHDLELQGSPDTLAVLDFVEAFSPEISPFKTFTTSKASLGFDIAEPDVYIPGVRREECEDGNESEDHGEDEGAEKMNYNYEEDMILETDSEGFVTAYLFGHDTHMCALVLHLCSILQFLSSPPRRLPRPSPPLRRRARASKNTTGKMKTLTRITWFSSQIVQGLYRRFFFLLKH